MLKAQILDVAFIGLGYFALLPGGWVLASDVWRLARCCRSRVLWCQGCELHKFMLLFLRRCSNIKTMEISATMARPPKMILSSTV